MTGVLHLDHVRVTRDGVALVDLNLTVPPGTVLTIMGPSGSGKSTALAAILGTLSPGFVQQGRIALAGCDITSLPPHLRKVGLLFQDDVLFPHLSVGANLAFGIPPAIKGRQVRRALVDAALDSAGLAGFTTRDPTTLSGGQRARVALMRTLLSEPCALLLDEPFSRLDTQLRSQIRDFVFERIRSAGLAAVLVTHDLEDAQAAGGPVVSPLGHPIPV